MVAVHAGECVRVDGEGDGGGNGYLLWRHPTGHPTGTGKGMGVGMGTCSLTCTYRKRSLLPLQIQCSRSEFPTGRFVTVECGGMDSNGNGNGSGNASADSVQQESPCRMRGIYLPLEWRGAQVP